MEENNLRVLRIWRTYLPNRDWWLYRSNLRQLNAYVKNLLQQRWKHRQQNLRDAAHPDVLDTIMEQMEVKERT